MASGVASFLVSAGVLALGGVAAEIRGHGTSLGPPRSRGRLDADRGGHGCVATRVRALIATAAGLWFTDGWGRALDVAVWRRVVCSLIGATPERNQWQDHDPTETMRAMRAKTAPGRARTPTAAAWIGCAVTATLALGRVVLAIIEPTMPPGASGGGDGPAVVVLEALMLTSFAVLGAIVASHQPHNPIGWLLGLIPLSFGLLFVGDSVYWNLASRAGDTPRLGAYAAWLGDWTWIGAIVPAFTLIPLLFPTGRPLSHRWRPVAGIAIAAGTATAAGTAFAPGRLQEYRAVPNPLGIDSAVVEALGAVGGACLVPVAVASVASLVVRYRRSTGVKRQQITWVASASVLLVLSFIGASVGGDAAFVLLLIGLLFVACAVAVAMLRYRLYDIDVVINRTLVYGALTGLLAAAYLGSVLLLQLVLSPSSGLAVAGSTLAVAGLVRPARARIQALVDRRFFRSKYDAQGTLEAFTFRLRDQVSLDALDADLRAVVAETLQPAHVSLWLRPR
jgi:hypothetical protein